MFDGSMNTSVSLAFPLNVRAFDLLQGLRKGYQQLLTASRMPFNNKNIILVAGWTNAYSNQHYANTFYKMPSAKML